MKMLCIIADIIEGRQPHISDLLAVRTAILQVCRGWGCEDWAWLLAPGTMLMRLCAMSTHDARPTPWFPTGYQ